MAFAAGQTPDTGQKPAESNSAPTTETSGDLAAPADSSHARPSKGLPWTEDEHLAFLSGLKKLGRGNWRGIAKHYVPSRTSTQVASHAQKHFIRLSGATKRKSRFTALEAEVLGTTSGVSGQLPAVPGNSSGSSGQQQPQQSIDDAAASDHQAAAHQQAMAAQQQQAMAAFPMAAASMMMGMHPMMASMMGMHPVMASMMSMMGMPPFMPPFMFSTPAMAAAAMANMQKQGMPMMPMFGMPPWGAAMSPYAMWSNGAAAGQPQPTAQDGAGQPESGMDVDQQPRDDKQPQEQEQQSALLPQPPQLQTELPASGGSPLLQPVPQLFHPVAAAAAPQPPAAPAASAVPQPAPPSPGQACTPGSARSPSSGGTGACKPEAPCPRRPSGDDANAILSMLPSSSEVQVAHASFHASSHSAFRAPQQIRAES